MPLRHVPAPALVLEMDCAALLIAWKAALDERPERTEGSFTHDGWRCRVIFEPLGIPIVGDIPADVFTESQRDVMDVLKAATRRLTRPEIMDNLEAAGKIHGERTIADALGKLLDRRLIVGPRAGSKDGYRLASVT